MIRLLQLHWKFIRRPAAAIEENIRYWPVWLGIAVNLFGSFLPLIIYSESTEFILRTESALFRTPNLVSTYFAMLLWWAMIIGVQYQTYPWIIARIKGVETDLIDADLIRKTLFYSTAAGTIYNTIIVLPLVAGTVLLVSDGSVGRMGVALAFLLSVAEFWNRALALNGFVIQWKSFRGLFDLSAFWTIFLVFILPLVLTAPLLIAGWSQLMEIIRGQMR